MPMETVTKLPYTHPHRWDGSLFGGPRLWRPSELGASLQLWLDAEDTASLTLVSGLVSIWNDKSGNNRNASQATAGNRPTYNTSSGINSLKPSIRFGLSGATTSLSIASSFYPLLSYPVITVAVARAITTSFGGIITSNGAGEDGRRGILIDAGSGHYSCGANPGAGMTGTGGASVANQNIIISGESATSSSHTLHYNGTQVASTTNTASTPSTYSATTELGRYRTGGDTNFGNFELGELIVATSSTSRTLIEGYLAWKWLMQSTLPSGHPYKTAPPTA